MPQHSEYLAVDQPAVSEDAGDGAVPGGLEPPVQARLHAAGQRDLAADRRDALASVRDRAADERDRLSTAQVGDEQRACVSRDRDLSASDRMAAARERLQARADRESLARRLWAAEVDGLTGARTRVAGLTDLDIELDRCRRGTGQLVVAYIDVVGLKQRNDEQGHQAGDELLVCVVELITKHLRSYDLVVRLGGDEFLCAMSSMTLTEARRRFGTLSIALAEGPHAGAISIGFAALEPHDTAAELIARADRELHDSRRNDVRTRPTPRRVPTASQGR